MHKSENAKLRAKMLEIVQKKTVKSDDDGEVTRL